MRKRVPLITLRHKELRIQFSNANINRIWNNVIITDECSFDLYGNKNKHLRYNGSAEFPAPKFSKKVMVFGALCLNGAMLSFIAGNIDSAKYCQTLNDHLLL